VRERRHLEDLVGTQTELPGVGPDKLQHALFQLLDGVNHEDGELPRGHPLEHVIAEPVEQLDRFVTIGEDLPHLLRHVDAVFEREVVRLAAVLHVVVAGVLRVNGQAEQRLSRPLFSREQDDRQGDAKDWHVVSPVERATR
jgi:hypothetical protein